MQVAEFITNEHCCKQDRLTSGTSLVFVPCCTYLAVKSQGALDCRILPEQGTRQKQPCDGLNRLALQAYCIEVATRYGLTIVDSIGRTYLQQSPVFGLLVSNGLLPGSLFSFLA